MERQETKTIIEPYEHDGKKLIRVSCGDFDFGIGLHNLSDRATWKEALEIARKESMEVPSKETWHIVAAHLDRINEAIKETGGDPLRGFLWSSSEYGGHFAWLFFATNGSLHYNGKMFVCSVRGSLDFRKQ